MMRKIFLLCLIGLAACGKPKGKNLSILLDTAPSPLHVPLFAGEYAGIFEKYGISICFSTPTEGSIRTLLSKKVDMVLFPMHNTIKAAEALSALRVVGAYIKTPVKGFIFREECNVHDPLDFHLKTIAAFPQGFLGEYLKSCIINSSVSFVDTDDDLTTTLLAHKADIISSASKDVEGEKLAAMGIKTEFLPLSAFEIPDYQEEVFVALEGVIKKNMIRKFQKALDEAIAFSRDNPDLAFEYYLAMNPDKDTATLEWERIAWKKITPCLAEDQDFQKDQWQEFHEWMMSKNLLTKRIDLNKLLEHEGIVNRESGR